MRSAIERSPIPGCHGPVPEPLSLTSRCNTSSARTTTVQRVALACRRAFVTVMMRTRPRADRLTTLHFEGHTPMTSYPAAQATGTGAAPRTRLRDVRGFWRVLLAVLAPLPMLATGIYYLIVPFEGDARFADTVAASAAHQHRRHHLRARPAGPRALAQPERACLDRHRPARGRGDPPVRPRARCARRRPARRRRRLRRGVVCAAEDAQRRFRPATRCAASLTGRSWRHTGPP